MEVYDCKRVIPAPLQNHIFRIRISLSSDNFDPNLSFQECIMYFNLERNASDVTLTVLIDTSSALVDTWCNV